MTSPGEQAFKHPVGTLQAGPPIGGYCGRGPVPSVEVMDNRTTKPHPTQMPPTARALAPDLARGLMLALVAVANVMIYLHDRPYGLRQHIVEDGIVDQWTTAAVVTLIDGRAYPLFALLFGYGLVRVLENQQARGLSPEAARRVLRRRSAWLLVLGFGHALLAFSGDILGWYGLLGILLTGLLSLGDRLLLRAATLWLVVAGVVQGLIYSDPGVRTERGLFWSIAIDEAVLAAGWRLVEWLMTPVGLLAVVSPLLVGFWAARHRILEEPARHLPLLRCAAVVGIVAGVAGGLPVGLATVGVWSPGSSLLLVLSWLHVVTGVACGLGGAALIALWAARIEARGRPVGRFVVALRAAGARSLSCYLAQSVVFASLLPAWSLGWGATLGTAGAAALGLVTWVLTVLLADKMARSGRPGPAETLLRRLSYGSSRGATRRLS